MIDFHVNFVPSWVPKLTPAEIADETGNLSRNLSLPVTRRLHETSTLDHLLADAARAGASRCVVFPYQFKNADRCKRANADLAAELALHPDRLLGLAICQPRDPASLDDVAAMLDKPGVIGIKMKPRWGGFSLGDTQMLGPVCEMLVARNRILLTHITQSFHESTGDQVGDLVRLLRAFPKLKVVAAHMGAFIDVYDCHPPMRAVMDNLWIDISLPNSLGWLPSLMRQGRASRYLFASDFPYTGIEEMARAVDSLDLTSAEKEAVFSGNANALLRSIGVAA